MTGKLINMKQQLWILAITIVGAALWIPSCGHENSTVKGLNDPGGTYIEDCDRHLSQRSPTLWALSNVGCIIYGNGNFDKPAFMPALDNEFLFFPSGNGLVDQTCAVETEAKNVVATCNKRTFKVGTLDQDGNVDIASDLSFNVVIKDQQGYRLFSLEEDGEDALSQAKIGFALRKN